MPESPTHVEHRMCGLGNHRLRTPYRVIKNPHLIKFGRHINSELRSQPLCLSCYKDLIRLYNFKNSNAKRHLEERKRDASISTLTGSQASEATFGSSTGVSTLTASEDGAPTRRISGEEGPNPRDSSEDEGPTTSAAAAAKRAKRQLPAASSSESASLSDDDDDPNSNLSLNAVNGSRLPHIQPIPKRRQFIHLNKEAMDIYLAGTTGG
ncbi:uncharacterized protein LOC108025390 [Drosophila biarmipes]|uniref:uncharacterized protein LOC108025390 n=1 Tax=Drosophila biarmipes TaxID=125945 RepID=UPI0007E85CC3|nr:uncharacterized protein LOC108025390 [Drosophila biarmipes]